MTDIHTLAHEIETPAAVYGIAIRNSTLDGIVFQDNVFIDPAPGIGAILATAAIVVAIYLSIRVYRQVRREARRLRWTMAQLQEGMDNMPGHLVVYDAADRVIMCNAIYRSLHIRGFARYGDHPRYADLMRCTAELACDNPDDIEAWVASHVTAQRDADGTPSDREYPDGTWIRVTKHRTPSGGVVGYGADVTELKQREQALEQSERRYFALTESAPMGIWQYDGTGTTVYANPVLRRLLGLDSAAANIDDYAPMDRLFPEADDRSIRTWLLEGEDLRQTEARLRTVDSSERVLLLVRSRAIVDPRLGHSFVVTVADITERREAEREAEFLASHDQLTGLANRAAFIEAVQGTIDKSSIDTAFGIVLFDLNYFKDVNDTFGHEVGDQLLIQAAQRIAETIDTSGLAARLGGDEFAVLIAPSPDRKEVVGIAQEVNSRLAASYTIDKRKAHVGASAGVAMYPEHGKDVETIMRYADIALYDSKTERDGSVTYFEPHMAATIGEQKRLEDDLRAALEAGDLELTYQPQFDLASRQLVGFEVLARWYNSRLGKDIPPDVFIPLAERSGLIFELEMWVLGTACMQARTWLDAGYKRTVVAINLSPAEFRRQHAAPLIRQALKRSGLPPSQLEIEITEQILLNEVHTRQNTLSELRADGVRIAIDDFGQGNAAIGVLRHLPLDRLKLDKEFMVGSTPECGERAVAAAIVDVGRSFGLDIVAQGVESRYHIEYAQQLGCAQGQGRYLGVPRKVDELSWSY